MINGMINDITHHIINGMINDITHHITNHINNPITHPITHHHLLHTHLLTHTAPHPFPTQRQRLLRHDRHLGKRRNLQHFSLNNLLEVEEPLQRALLSGKQVVAIQRNTRRERGRNTVTPL